MSVWLVPVTLQAQSVVEDYLEQVRYMTGAPGISVAVAVKGEIVFSKGVGYAELENRTPATGSTVHNVGSVSKVLATVAVMQLVEFTRRMRSISFKVSSKRRVV